MINSRELRIGNKLTKDTGVIFTVYEVKQNSVKATYQAKDRDFPPPTPRDRLSKGERMAIIDFDKLSPIPLSPEILEKAGIERTGNLASTAARKFYRIGRIIFESIPDNRVAVYIDSETESILIGYKDYLHQLQNLVFDISGQELTINLK